MNKYLKLATEAFGAAVLILLSLVFALGVGYLIGWVMWQAIQIF